MSGVESAIEKETSDSPAFQHLPTENVTPVLEWMQSLGPHQPCNEEITVTGAIMCSVMMLNSIIERTGNRVLEAQGLTFPQWLALGCIANSGEDGAPHGHIGQKLMLSKAPVTGIVDRLERASFVERRPDAKDRRISRVHITEEGLNKWMNAKEALRGHSFDTLEGHLTVTEQEQLLCLLGQLMKAFAAEDPTISEGCR